MKTNCPMKQMLQDLTHNHDSRNPETNHECCIVLLMKYLVTTQAPLELIEEIRKVIES